MKSIRNREPNNCRRRLGANALWLASASTVAMLGSLLTPQQVHAQNVSFTTVVGTSGPNLAYYAGDINSCAVDVNNLTTATVGANTYQFLAYYTTGGAIRIARRTVGGTTWSTAGTGISISTSFLSDDHNTIAAAIDSNGIMHMSYNMHNVSLNYATSNASVMGTSFGSGGNVAFTVRNSTNAPTLFPSAGATTNSVTYPCFYNIPGSNNLLFTYRNGGAGGGSGNGNEYFNVYNPTTQTWSNTLVIDGISSSVNAYLNNLVYTSTNNLLMTWTWRYTSAWQTNENIMYAQSPDNGTTWYKQGGSPQYTLPITQSTAQVIKNISQNSSFINQTSMAVDANNNPFIGTWWAPGESSGNHNRQYMLQYYTGTEWRTSQVTNRTSDTSVDTSAAFVRDLGRPLTLIDPQGRVLMVTRSQDSVMGGFANPSVTNNIVVWWNTVASLDSASPDPWQSITLDSGQMGSMEPTYDANLWRTQHKFSMFYLPTGITGQSQPALKVLDWDEQAYFASLSSGEYFKDLNGSWGTASNWNNAVIPNAVSAIANLGGTGGPTITAAHTVTLDGTKTVGTFRMAGSNAFTLNVGTGGSLALDNGATAASFEVTSGTHTVNAPITLNAAGATFNIAGTLNATANISGAGNLTKTGIGTMIFTGTGGWNNTTISAGTLQIGNGGATGALPAGSVAINSGALAFNRSGNITVANIISGASGQVIQNGSGILTLTGANTFGTSGGGIIVNSGTLRPGNATALASGILASVNGGTFDVNGNSLTLGGLGSISTSTGVVTDQSAGAGTTTITLNQTTTSDYYGAINDGSAKALALVKSNTGTIRLRGASNYSGGTSISNGFVELYNSNALGTGTVTLTADGVTRVSLAAGLNVPNHFIINAANASAGTNGSIMSISGSATLSGGIDVNAVPTAGGHLAGPTAFGPDFLNITGPINMGGTATAVIVRAGNVKFSGGGNVAALRLDNGLYALAANNGIPTNALVTMSSNGASTFDLSGFNQILTGVVRGAANTTIITNSSTTASMLTLNASTANTYVGTITGNLGVIKSNSATYTFTGANTYTGPTTVSGGTLVIGTNYTPVTNSTTRLNTNTGATAQINTGVAATFDGMASNGTVNVIGTLNITGTGNSTAQPFTGTGTLNLTNGTLALVSGTFAASDIGTLSITSNGKLDLLNRGIIVHTTGGKTAIQNLIVSGQNGFDNNGLTRWNGPGIMSTTARNQNVALGVDVYAVGVIRNGDLNDLFGAGSAYSNWGGKTVGTEDVLTRYTYAGDTDLSGSITIDDYNAIDAAYLGLIPMRGWISGDFDFNGAITIDDYNAIDTGYLYQGGQLTQSLLALRTAQFGAAYASQLELTAAAFARVPEPATLGLVGLAAIGLLARRRGCR